VPHQSQLPNVAAPQVQLVIEADLLPETTLQDAADVRRDTVTALGHRGTLSMVGAMTIPESPRLPEPFGGKHDDYNISEQKYLALREKPEPELSGREWVCCRFNEWRKEAARSTESPKFVSPKTVPPLRSIAGDPSSQFTRKGEQCQPLDPEASVMPRKDNLRRTQQALLRNTSVTFYKNQMSERFDRILQATEFPFTEANTRRNKDVLIG